MLIIAAVAVSPLTLSVSTDPCARCHSSRHPYAQYLDILEGDTGNQIPAVLNLSETKTVKVAIQNYDDVEMFSTLSQVSVTLSSTFGHFQVSNPTYSISNMPVGTAIATWQITGTSDGYDYLTIQATGFNSHASCNFYDSYSSYPLVTVGQVTGTPPPYPTPTPAQPTPTPTSQPSTPAQTSTPTPTNTPSTSTQPSATPSTTQTELSIELTSPTQGIHWSTNSKQTIQWQANGGTGTLKVKLEYIINSQEWFTLATDLPASGSYQWTTPDTPSTCAIRATVQDASTSVQSNSATTSFEVEKPQMFDLTTVAIIAVVVVGLLVAVFVVYKMRAKKPT